MYAPNVDPHVVIQARATAYRSVIPEDQVKNGVTAYYLAINHCFDLAARVFVCVLGMGMKEETLWPNGDRLFKEGGKIKDLLNDRREETMGCRRLYDQNIDRSGHAK